MNKYTFYAVGQNSKKIYVSGSSRAECMRELIVKFPTFHYKSGKYKQAKANDPVLPETIRIVYRRK